MYYLLSFLTGLLIAVMIAINGGLTLHYGIYSATIIIHLVGLVLISLLLLGKRHRFWRKGTAWYLLLGGALGVAATVFNNVSFGKISVSAILALGLLGQSLVGLFIDQWGLMNMPRHRFHISKLAGLLLMLAGITVMIRDFQWIAVSASFFCGVLLVIARTLNAQLAERTSVRISTFYNYLTGLVFAMIACAIWGRNEPMIANFTFSTNPILYFGGILGVGVVLLSNLTVSHISAFYLSIIIFIGQVFAGLIIDAVLAGTFALPNLIGGILATAGLCLNLIFDRVYNVSQSGE